MDNLERRFTTGRVALRAAQDKRAIGGYASVFNKQSNTLGGFVEMVRNTAFNESRSRDWPNVVARFNHDDNMLLGTTAAGTLRLSIDETGLMYETDPPASRADIYELVERGDINSSSFAFRTLEDDWATSEQGYPLRSLIKVQLVDVAPVVSPAYPDATAGLRSAEVGLRSLAKFVAADIEDVREVAAANELRKFFVQTGPVAARQKFGAAARAELLGKAQDPWV